MLLLFCLYKRKTNKNKIHSCPSLTNNSETKPDTLEKSIPTATPLKKKQRRGKPNDYIIEHLDKSLSPEIKSPKFKKKKRGKKPNDDIIEHLDKSSSFEIKPPKLKRTTKFRLKTNENIDDLVKSSTPKTNRQIPWSPEEKTNSEN